MSTPPVFIVVLNWHGRAHTLDCLRSLAGLSYPEAHVILLDNGCCDFSADEVRELVPEARYLQTEVNLGFTGGVNLGIRHALQWGAQYVMLLNNDTRVEPDAVTELIAVAEADPAIGVVGAKLLQLDAAGRLESAGLHVDLKWGRVYQIGFGEPDRGQYDLTSEAVAVSGGAMLLSRALCERLRGFDDRYFRYLEDVDFCLRARRAGFRVALAPRARVHHKGKGTTGGQTSPVILYYATRNHLMLMREHGDEVGLVRWVRAATVVALNALYALRTAGGSRAARLRAVWHAVADYQRRVVGPGWGAEQETPSRSRARAGAGSAG